MGKKKFQVPSRYYAICHRQGAKQGIQKDSITGTHERRDFVEKCILSMKKNKKIKQ